jgi:hypothetical protein
MVKPEASAMRPSVAQYSICPATERRMGVAASRAWVTKPAGNLTDAKEEGDADMRRSFMAHFAPKRTHLAIWRE